MSVGVQHSIVDLDEEDSPRQNNGAMDDSVASIRLPDLTDILAALNKKDSSPLDSPSAITSETRAFGTSIAQFNHFQADGSVAKPVAKKPRKQRIPKEQKPVITKEKKARAPRAPKDSAKKAIKKKPLTITERAVAPFLAPSESSRPSTAVDKSILDFLTPAKPVRQSCAIDTAVKKKVKSTAKRKPRGKTEALSILTPRTARRKHGDQTLVYSADDSPARDKSHVLNPSKLISLSRGLFSKGSRGLSDELTDGGPHEGILDREAAEASEDDLLDLTMLPSKTAQDEQSAQEDSQEVLDHDNDHYTAQQSDDAKEEFQTSQEYLRRLVECSDGEKSDVEFPVTPVRVPINIRSDTIESLRDILELDHQDDRTTALDATDELRVLSGTSSGSKRSRSAEQLPTRSVSQKLSELSSPGIPDKDEDHVVVISSSAEQMPSLSPRAVDLLPQAIEVGQIKDVTGLTQQSTAKDLIRSDFLQQHEENELLMTTVTRPRPGRRKSKRDTLPEPVGHTLDLTKPASTKTKGRKLTTSGTKSDDDYWVIPDSEDEAQVSVLPTRKEPQVSSIVQKTSKTVERPKFEGFTTAKLQTEISRFGFKSSKNRAGMIQLLNKCWEAKNKTSTTPVVNLQDPQFPTTTLPATKTASSNIMPCIDLIDNDSITTTTVPTKTIKKRLTAAEKAARLAAQQEAKELLKSQRAAQKLADKEADRVAAIEATRQLHLRLTHLLRVDNSHHGWWQKILTYEPIVLEDFTEWLKAHHGIEAEPDDVRDYFDLKGVCCAKRLGRSGKGRRRF